MTKVSYVNNLTIKSRINPFLIENPRPFPQEELIEKFLNLKSIEDVFYVNKNFDIPDRTYICIVLIINPDNFISTEDLKLLLNNFSKFSNLYFYVALNKFLVYSETDLKFESNSLDFDEKLIEYFSNISNFTLVYSKSRSDDLGNLGNFIYPVTQMIFKKNE
jgi:hypothetical protein